jgi:hypothetical protein
MAVLTPAPLNFQQKIRSELAEGLQLSYADIIPVVLNLRVTMAATGAMPAAVLPTPQSDYFRMPGDYALLVSEMRADVTLNSISTETTASATGLNAMASVIARTTVKALNAKATLVNSDRNDLTVIETQIQNSSTNGALKSALCLASLMPVAGGSPLKFIDKGYVMPLIVPANERLTMTITLADANAAIGSTEYGLTLLGALVRSDVG